MKFLIATAAYTHLSGGILVLHQLCDALCCAGHDASLVFFHDGEAPHFKWAVSANPAHYGPGLQHAQIPMENATAGLRTYLDEGITIYPDLIEGNPLDAKHVVRYFLYKNLSYHPAPSGEYLLAFSRVYHPNPHKILFKTLLIVQF